MEKAELGRGAAHLFTLCVVARAVGEMLRTDAAGYSSRGQAYLSRFLEFQNSENCFLVRGVKHFEI